MGEQATGATVNRKPIPDTPDLPRLRAERFGRLQDQLADQGLDGLVLLSSSAVAYAAGLSLPGDDSGRAVIFRPVVVVAKGESAPHVYTAARDGLPPELPPDHAHGPLFPDLDDGAEAFVEALSDHFPAGARLAVDHQTHPMLRHLGHYDWCDGRAALAPAKLCKTADELACIRTAQRISELAMVGARETLRPGVRQSDLSAVFLRRAFELGASAGSIDPIWQVMPAWKEQGPWTSHGDLAYPTATTDRILREGDVIWVDAGLLWEGYASDYGRTWITSADPDPTPRQREQFLRWRQVVDAVLAVLGPGVSATALGRAATEANDGVRPWIEHFYLAHGVGTDSAEMPLIGTDLGPAFDDAQLMEPGMVVVLEPVIWDDGAAGYRAEDIVAVTDTGWVPLSGSTYDPFTPPS
ncbi:MAG: M24 family metallopeptidase [Acidimicrobiales bacterium]